VDGSIRNNCQFEGDTFLDAQRVKADERRLSAVVVCSDRRIMKISRAEVF